MEFLKSVYDVLIEQYSKIWAWSRVLLSYVYYAGWHMIASFLDLLTCDMYNQFARLS